MIGDVIGDVNNDVIDEVLRYVIKYVSFEVASLWLDCQWGWITNG